MATKIPNGWCQCGCGKKAPIVPADKTWKKMGRVAGQPFARIRGHGKKQHWDKYIVDPNSRCWNWTGPIDRLGYAHSIQIGGRGAKTWRPMRYFYTVLIGPIPEGLVLDHLCRNRPCVNPFHLEPVESKENTRRGASTKLTMPKVCEIKKLISEGTPGGQIAKQFGVSHATICDIKMGRRWI